MKATYVKKNPHERAVAKATIRYIQRRPGKDNEHMSRHLFGIDGFMGRAQAYQLVDEAPKGRYFYRIVVNPDPLQEDQHKDLPLRELITATMQTLQERRDTPVAWVAVVHDDHTDKRHIHALAIVKGRLKTEDLQALREAATAEAQVRRRERDLLRAAVQLKREREEAEWER